MTVQVMLMPKPSANAHQLISLVRGELSGTNLRWMISGMMKPNGIPSSAPEGRRCRVVQGGGAWWSVAERGGAWWSVAERGGAWWSVTERGRTRAGSQW